MVVNKIDNNEIEKTYEFYNLGLGEPFGISAEHGNGIGELLDDVVAKFKSIGTKDDDESLHLAVVGKPNAGKSSLCNKLLGFDRTIVSDIAGTTRDAIDTKFSFDGKNYTLIDTAGIRKKKNVEEDIEYYSVLRALGSIRRADVCVMMIDASVGITEQDVKILGYVHEQNKPSVVVMNKWDLIEKDTNTINKFNDLLGENLKFMDYMLPVYVSAKTGQRVEKIIALCNLALENSLKRITAGKLNDLICSYMGGRVAEEIVTQDISCKTLRSNLKRQRC